MDLEDLLKLLEKAGVSKEDLEKGLKDLNADATKEEIAEAIGRIIGKFGGGIVSGTTGLDPDLIKLLLDLFGPAAKAAIGRLLEELLGEREGFKTRKPGTNPWRRERINLDGPGLVDDNAPDIELQETPVPGCCERVDQLAVSLNFAIKHREEDIEKLKVEAYNQDMKPVAVASKLNVGNNELVEANGDKHGSDTEEGDWVEVEMTVCVPCEFAIAGGGTVLLQYSIVDVDGNYVTDFIFVSFTDLLIDPDRECCKNFRIESIKEKLIERLTDLMGEGGFSIQDFLEELTKPAENEDEELGGQPETEKKEKASKVAEEKTEKKIEEAETDSGS